MADVAPADAGQRSAALDPERSFIVQAPAGSGKTTLLVQRYLGLLARAEQPERVMAITFTRKAAAEMRGRIARALADARLGLDEAARRALSPDKRETLALAEAVFERDQSRTPEERWDLDRYPARLRVLTFDALCLDLAGRMPVLSQFGAVPEPTEDDEPLLAEGALRTLGCLYGESDPVRGAVETLLDYLDNDWPRAQALLADMLRQRGQWRLDPEQPPTREELDRALTFSVGHFLERIADRVPDGIRDELMALARHAGTNLRDEGSDSPIATLADGQGIPGPGDVAQWRGLAEFLLTRDKPANWRKSVNRNQGFPPGKEGKPFKDRMTDLLVSLAEEVTLRELLDVVRRIPVSGYDERQAEVLEALHAVLVRALAEMRLVVSERGQADFGEIALRAEHALGDSDAPSELLLRLDYALDHLLVDEFQDTSWSQYRLLAQLTAGWQDGDGRTLFLVGDPMQSIYRFRDAEVGLFIDVWQSQRLGSVPLEPLRLSVNFRSAAPLVAWFNECFRHVLPRRSDAAVGAVAYSEAAPRPGASTDVEGVVCHPCADRAGEARVVAALARRLRADSPGESVAVLVRSRRHLDDILPAFHRELDRPYLGQKLERLHEHPDVGDAMALTRALLHPADRVAWLGVLRAPWCGLSREALFAVSEHAGKGAIVNILDDLPALADPDDAAALQRVAPLLLEAMAARHSRALRDWVEATWLSLGGPDACHDERGLAAVAAYLDELEAMDEDGDLPDPPWLEQRLAERFVPPDPLGDEGIQVMTMHQAKGLQFDHVILPGLERYGRGGDRPLQVWHDLPGADAGGRTLAAVMDPPDTAAEESTVYGFVLALESERQDYELGRLLYVACTRAKQSLHLFAAAERDPQGDARVPDRRSLLRRLWPACESGFTAGAPDPAPLNDDLPEAGEPPLRRFPPDWRPPDPGPHVAGGPGQTEAPAPAAPIEFDWVSEPGRVAGVVVHEYLQRVAAEGLDRWDESRLAAEAGALRRRLSQHGVTGERRQEMVERVTRALNAAVTEPEGRWILAARDSARNEYALSHFEGGRLQTIVIDRTFVDDDGVRWIIDYKASERRGDEAEFLDQEAERYRDQIQRYARVLRKLEGNERPVRAALYYPLLGVLREVDV